MLMPSQSPPSTITIQTLPSDQQQQQEYVDTSNGQASNLVIKFRREKSMEFGDDTEFHNNIDDDINNNHSVYEPTSKIIQLESSSPSSISSMEDDSSLMKEIPSQVNHLSKSVFDNLIKHGKPVSSNRKSANTVSNRSSIIKSEQITTITNINDLDPNVFLISSDTNSHNTIRKTKHDVKRFVLYIDEQFEERKPLHTIPAESLCRYLKHYFENTKKFDGTQYEPDTLRSFLLSIERYLKSKKYEYNLMESPLFQSCRQVITSKREQWRKMGGGNHANNHHQAKPSVILSNIKNITTFDRTKPDVLLLEIYVHMMKLSQDKSVLISQLLWGDIALIDEQYLIRQRPKSENQTIRLYATPSQPSVCPVQAYRLYAIHRPPQCNTPQSPFFLMPRTSTCHHIWYKTATAAKNLEQVLQNAVQHNSTPKPLTTASSISNLKAVERQAASIISESSTPKLLFNGKRSSSTSLSQSGPRTHLPSSLMQLPNLIVPSNSMSTEDESFTISSSPINSVSNDVVSSSSPLRRDSPSITNVFHKPLLASAPNSVWDESVTDILLTVAKQRDTRVMKINILRTYLEEKLGVVEFLCLYRGFKSEPKLTFHGTPWEHYQRFLPVLFTLLALDNTTI